MLAEENETIHIFVSDIAKMEKRYIDTDISYKFGSPDTFSIDEINSFLSLLRKQGKIENPTKWKLMRCKHLGAGCIDGNMICIGAIKPKTKSVFGPKKANLPEIGASIEWEIGYFFTESLYEGNGYSSKIFDGLLSKFGNDNLMAITEIKEGNKMINSLENRGFVQQGNSWAGANGNENLRLFLKHVDSNL